MAPPFESKDSISSPYITCPDPCDRCRRTACSTLHDYSASSCPYNVCQECHELEVLDAQITEIHNLLIDLTNKRHELKNRINRCHDRLTSHLPLETVSHIFSFIADESLHTLVMLGVVCKRWREITLGTPQLWTKIVIDHLNVDDSTLPNIIAQCGSQSCGLPLSLKVDLDDWDCGVLTQLSVQLLRSQAHRWKDLTLVLHDPNPMLNMILMGLEDSLIVDSLTIHISGSTPLEVDRITMKYPFAPERLDIYDIRLPQIPLEWERLTHLRVGRISADALIHVFDCAHHLRCCLLGIVNEDAGHYPLPTSSVTNTSVKELDITLSSLDVDTGLLLRHLTLPSLETLRCNLIDDLNDSGEEMGAIRLRAFLDRSRPPLRAFSLYHYHWPSQSISSDWCRLLPSITSLDLEASSIDRVLHYLGMLASRVEPQTLPCLRELCIEEIDMDTEDMSVDFWNGLVGLFPESEGKDTPPVTVVRPLKTVTVRTTGRTWDLTKEIMSKTTHARLRAIQQSGVELHAFDENDVDLLGPDIELTFDDTEDKSNSEGSSESGMEEGLDED